MKRYWKVYVRIDLWKKVDVLRKKQNLKWTQLIEIMFKEYLAK